MQLKINHSDFENPKHAIVSLSGGMDSSSIIGSAVWSTGEKQQAFSSIYDAQQRIVIGYHRQDLGLLTLLGLI